MKTLTLKSTLVLSVLFISGSAWAQADSPVGRWKTIDDKTKQPKSIIEIRKEGDELKGKIVEILNPTEPNPLCKECPGDKKDKPMKGLEIIWGLRDKGEGEWADGSILDPQSGKTYKSKIKLKDNGEKLDVRGYVGAPLFGRSQTWEREK